VFFKKRLRNDYAFSKNVASFYQISAQTAEDGLIRDSHPLSEELGK
jgi:hypothetical protein